MRIPLIDMDILLHEGGYAGEFKDKETGEPVLLPPEDVVNWVDNKIAGICLDSESTEPPILFVTDSPWITKWDNKRRKREGLPPREYIHNFRYEIAKTQPYKGNRKNPKPFHYYNILSYLLAKYECVISTDGYEADDMLCMKQVEIAKEYGVAIRTHAGLVLVDYEDWVVYGKIKFIVDSKGYVINDTGKGSTRNVWALHRAIMGNPEGFHVDHINGNKLDNRKYNLRVCSTKENIRNSKAQEGTSEYKGVSFDVGRGKWAAGIKVDRKQIFLGRHRAEEDAAKAYDEAAKEYFGEYARLNFQAPCVKPYVETIICSRDKDLRICPLWHFSWECGKQGSIYPTETDTLGWLTAKTKWDEKKQENKFDDVLGYGRKFFYYQMLVGDSADHIPGLPGWGKVKAFNLLNDINDEYELYKTVQGLYKEVKGEEAKDYFFEQANLLWMTLEKGKRFETPSRK